MSGSSPVDLSGFIEFGEHALTEAVLLLESYFRKTTSTAKGPFDVVTEADHAVESMFAQRLRGPFPITRWSARRRAGDRRGSMPSIAGC